MRGIAFFAAASVVGCASSSKPAVPPPMPVETVRVAVTGGQLGIRTMPFQDSFVGTLPFPITQVWSSLALAYDSVGLKLSTLQPSSHTMGNEGINIRRVLGKTPLSTYIDCGKTQIDQNADTYEVHLAMVSSLAPVPAGGTKITTTLTAAAKPIAFAGDYVRCKSLGKLETRLHHTLYWDVERKAIRQ